MNTELVVPGDPDNRPPIGPVFPEPGYYRIRHNHDDQYYHDKGFVAGELAYVVPGQNAVHVIIGESEWTYDENELDEFDNDFEFDPNGASERQAEVTRLMQEVITEGHYGQLSHQLVGFQPHIENDDRVSTSTALTPVGGMAIQDVKKGVAEARNLVLRTQRDLKVKTKRLELLLSEQTRALAIKAKELEGMMKKAEEAIWTINLYLGKNEEIHHLVSGEPAPADEKIAIRQMILFMDEECALAARDGGIDVQSIEAFDQWIVSDPAHIQQVMPEQKGIIAFHIKRYRKEYADPWTNAQLNEANIHWTYFLIRNGENLYRVFVDIVLGGNLFPTKHEFDELFTTYETDYNHPDRPRVEKFLKPGSKEYMKAMEAADAKNRHYLRVVLILQGLLDRTPIFKPMPVERINICNMDACEEYVRLIYDHENTLGDGRPKFREWQTTINAQLDVGHRIIGVFNYSSKLRGDKEYEESRIYPRTACYPNSCALHTIEKRDEGADGEALVILYERTGDTIYGRSWRDRAHEATVRARCKLYRDDRFILNFDAATVEDMKYYMTSRLSRHEYRTMIPVLETAIKLKQQEIEEEAPFRLLLIGQIMKCFGASHTEAESRIDELIQWWKFKNRTHRALTSEDSKAIKMIVAEFGQRLKQESVRNRTALFNTEIIDTVMAANTGRDVILIAHKSDNKYAAYVAHNQTNVWVCEQTWTHNRTTNAVTLTDSRDWKLVDKRHVRWNIIHKTERWDAWRINPQMSQVLTDTELQEAVQFFLNKQAPSLDEDTGEELDETGEELDETGRFLPLCAYYTDDYEIKVWYSDRGPIIPKELLLTNNNDEPQIAHVEIKWERKKGGVTYRSTWPSHYCYNPSKVPWIRDYHGNKVMANIIRRWDDNVKQVANEFKQHDELKKTIRCLRDKYDYVVDLVTQRIYDEKVAAARKDFDAEYGDPDLWEDHLKNLKINKSQPHLLAEALHMHAEREIEVVGKTVEEVFDTAIKLGIFEGRSSDRLRTRGFVHVHEDDWEIPSDIPLEFVIPEAPPVVEDDDPDEDDEINEDE